MPTEKQKLPKLTWTSKMKKERKTQEFVIILWIFAVTFAIIFYIFTKNPINALVVIAGAFTLHMHFLHRPHQQDYKYQLTVKGLRVNDLLYPYSSIKRYRIMDDLTGKRVLAIDLLSVLTPDLVLPLDNVDEEDVDFFIGQFVEEDEKMPLPWTHVLAERLGL